MKRITVLVIAIATGAILGAKGALLIQQSAVFGAALDEAQPTPTPCRALLIEDLIAEAQSRGDTALGQALGLVPDGAGFFYRCGELLQQ